METPRIFATGGDQPAGDEDETVGNKGMRVKIVTVVTTRKSQWEGAEPKGRGGMT